MARVTLRDVAARVGVSVMTVSNVVNDNRQRVSPGTAARVEQAIAELGYVPNGVARSLVARRTRLVGLFLPARHDDVSLLGSPHDVAVTGAIEATLRRSDQHLMLRGIATRQDVLESLWRWNLDAIILMGFSDDELADLALPADVPTVVVDAYQDRADDGLDHPRAHSHVRSDDHEGGRLAGAHLTDLGHRRAVVIGPTGYRSRVVSERVAGFAEVLHEVGAPAPVVVDALTTYEEGVRAAPVIAGLEPRPTAVFATADILAAGLVTGFARLGLRVPGDLSVVGYDDIEIARRSSPPLTTVAQHTVLKGHTAAELVLDAIEQRHRSVVIPVELVERASTGPAGGAAGGVRQDPDA